MKKQFLLFIVLMTLPMVASADSSGKCGDNMTWTYTESTRTLTIEGTGAMNSYTNQRSEWKDYRGSIEKILIGSGVTSIGSYAFYDCSEVTSISIPDGLKSIHDYAFYRCKALTSINIPNSLTWIGSYAFYGCSALTSITIPSGVTQIGSAAFGYCNVLNSIVVESGNQVYDSRDNCNAIIMTSTNSLLYGCKTTIIPNSVKAIGSAFEGCSELTSITIPNMVTDIGGSAFSGCSSLTSIAIPNSVKLIGNKAFQNCKSLTSLTIGNSVTSIGEYAFENCKSLPSVTILKSLTSIGSKAFKGCVALTSIVVEIGNPVYDSRDYCNGIIETSTNALLVGCKSTIIPNTVTSIGNSAFEACSSLTSIAIPTSVTSIGNKAFLSCSGLTSISISNGVTSIGNSTFASCSGLTSINIPNSVTSIGNSTFASCSGLTSITIPNSVTSIGNSVFSYCKNLNFVVIGNSVTSIGNSAFEGDVKLQDVYCYSEQIPTTGYNLFTPSYLANATLHVPAPVITVYQAYSPWNEFGNIVALTDSDPKPTGIKMIHFTGSKAHDYFDLNGRKLINEPMQNGIYISNGRKVIVK